jgi:transcriptional regulator with XRE-family HTH domain
VWGTGKRRSKLGKWIDKKGYTQKDLGKVANLDKATVSRACSDPEYIPSGKTIQKIMKAVRKLDPKAKPTDFFDL